MTTSQADSPIPVWVKRWLGVCAFILAYEGSFCCLRPHSYPDGCLSMLYLPYRLYLQVDKHYADPKNTFVLVQGMLNLVEGALDVAVLIQASGYLKIFPSMRWTKLMAIASCIMTSWKSLLFLLWSYDLADGSRHVDDWFSNIALVFLPTSVFVLVPVYTAYVLMKDFAGDSKKERTPRKAVNDETDSPISPSRYNLRNR